MTFKQKKLVPVVLAIFLVCGALMLAGCGNAEKLQAYKFGSDSIPSINSVVGERNVNGVASGTGGGVTYKEYTYESQTVTQDLVDYLLVNLAENGWTPTIDFNLEDIPGKAQLAAESADSGNVLVIDVTYEQRNYTIKITKMEGTLTLN